MSNNNSVILVTSSYDHTMIFWDALSEYTLQQIEYPENVFLQNYLISKLSIELKFPMIKDIQGVQLTIKLNYMTLKHRNNILIHR